MSSDFDYAFLTRTVHRPWPLPDVPWIMTQSWHDLLFAHWAIEPAVVRPLVPAVFPVDQFDGRAWLGIVPFSMTNLAPRGLPAIPGLSAFPELNVRTYVTVDGKPGVFFLSLDATSRLAVRGARLFFHLPYFTAAMSVESRDGWIVYQSRRTDPAGTPARFSGRYRPAGPVHAPVPGTLEHFLTERYCLYTTDRQGTPCRLEIHHAQWPLQPAELEIAENTMAEAAGVRPPAEAPLLHFAGRQDIVGWPLQRIAARPAPGSTPPP
jgi:uncharacterized protein